ncbi:outer membrane beta-barrel protein [Zobellella taiwanensis]
MHKKNKLFTLSAVATGILFAGQADAIEPQAVDLGGVGFIPTVKLSETYDDNVWEAPEGEDKRSSWVTSVEPTFTLAARDRLNTYQLSYRLNHSIYHSVHEDDHTDHFVNADSHMEFNARNRLDLKAGYSKQQDTRDSTNRDFDEQGNKYHATNIGGLYGFGAEAAKMQLEFGANHEWRRYDNNTGPAATSSATQEKDRDTLSLSTTAYYRVGPKTRLLAEIQRNDYDYVTSNLDSEAWRYLLGATWQATAKTSGTVKVGFEDKDFDNPAKNDPDNSTWEVGVTWEPLTYSRVKLNTSSRAEEGSSTEDYVDTSSYGFSWEHDWTPRITSNLGYTLTEKDYKGGSNEGRSDDLDVYNIGVNYKMRRWLDLGVGYTHKDNASNSADDRYDRNQVYFNANVSL